jgi:hypothetical protein
MRQGHRLPGSVLARPQEARGAGIAAALALGANALGAPPAHGAEASMGPRVIEVERYPRTKFYKDPYGGT